MQDRRAGQMSEAGGVTGTSTSSSLRHRDVLIAKKQAKGNKQREIKRINIDFFINSKGMWSESV